MAMYAVVVKGGKFTFTVDRDLARGLRPSAKNPRNEEYLITCDGAVGRDGVLCALESMTRLDTSIITDGFPFPQVFNFSYVTIICGLQTIYEYDADAGTMTLKYTAAAAGGPWDAVDFHGYIYLSNGRIAVVRDHADGAYSLSSDLPFATSMCDYNGQVLITGPDMQGNGASLMLPMSAPSATVTLAGSISTT